MNMRLGLAQARLYTRQMAQHLGHLNADVLIWGFWVTLLDHYRRSRHCLVSLQYEMGEKEQLAVQYYRVGQRPGTSQGLMVTARDRKDLRTFCESTPRKLWGPQG